MVSELLKPKLCQIKNAIFQYTMRERIQFTPYGPERCVVKVWTHEIHQLCTLIRIEKLDSSRNLTSYESGGLWLMTVNEYHICNRCQMVNLIYPHKRCFGVIKGCVYLRIRMIINIKWSTTKNINNYNICCLIHTRLLYDFTEACLTNNKSITT